MPEFRAIIIDDERHGRENLALLLDKYCEGVVIEGLADSPETANVLISEKKPDVVFLDIEMPYQSGFEFLESLEEKDFFVVFVSAHSQYGIKAIKVNAVDYLLKPVIIKELRDCVSKLHKLVSDKKSLVKESPAEKEFRKHADENKIIVSHFQGFTMVNIKDIVRLSGADNYTTIFTADEKQYTTSRTLKDYENVLHPDTFYRIHKSTIINLDHFKEFTNLDGGYAIMNDGSKLMISRRRLQDFLNTIKSRVSNTR